VGQPEPGKHGEIEPWEFDLIRKVASRFETTERQDLEAELARSLFLLKTGTPAHIRNWKAYIAKALLNRASNWIRDWRVRQSRNVPLLPPGEEDSGKGFSTEDALFALEAEADIRLALKLVRDKLGPDLHRLWDLLIEEDGNQLAVARRLGMHRNTVRLWIGKIRRVLKQHGFRDPDSF
jgi:DNA-directed RNA polymerase specialized sigma24 family protein